MDLTTYLPQAPSLRRSISTSPSPNINFLCSTTTTTTSTIILLHPSLSQSPHTLICALSAITLLLAQPSKACRADVYTGTAWLKSDASSSSLVTAPAERPVFLCKSVSFLCDHCIPRRSAYRLLTSAFFISVFSKGTFPEVSKSYYYPRLYITRASTLATRNWASSLIDHFHHLSRATALTPPP